MHRALAMSERLYPAQKFPRGHRETAASLNVLAALLLAQGEYAQAETYARRNLEMNERLYPAAEYPHGHGSIAKSLANLGITLSDQGRFDDAEKSFLGAGYINARLYPKEKYPKGHSEIAACLQSLGILCREHAQYDRAVDFARLRSAGNAGGVLIRRSRRLSPGAPSTRGKSGRPGIESSDLVRTTHKRMFIIGGRSR